MHDTARTAPNPNFYLSAALLLGGGALCAGALARHPTALQMLPGYDGSLTAGVVGVLLALLHGLPYRRVLLLVGAPLVAIQLAVFAAMGVPFVALLGVELVAFGIFGLPLSLAPPRAAPASASAPASAPVPASAPASAFASAPASAFASAPARASAPAARHAPRAEAAHG